MIYTFITPFEFPDYAEPIINRLKELNWISHLFFLEDDDCQYNPAMYLANGIRYEAEYSIIFDVNIYQYILNAYKKPTKSQVHRDGIALLVFCQFTNIQLNPTYAIYEKVDYKPTLSEELLDDLYLFRQIDNGKMDQLARFALCEIDEFDLGVTAELERDKIEYQLTLHRRLKQWDNYHAFILKLTDIQLSIAKSADEKMDEFFKWCHSHLHHSIPALSFAHLLFYGGGTKKLMKFSATMSLEGRKKAISNMVWDVFFINLFFIQLSEKNPNQDFIFATNDSDFKTVLDRAISVQFYLDKKSNGQPIPLTLKKAADRYIAGRDLGIEGRAAKNAPDFKAYRDELISELERKLLCKSQ